MTALIQQKISVINIGLASFSENIRKCQGNVTDLVWQPPANADAAIGWKLAQTIHDQRIDEANKIAYERYLAAQPILEGVAVAKEVIPNMEGKIILHSGPPITWEKMCGPQKGAVIGAILFEGWAKDHAEATQLVEQGAIRLEPCHHHASVGPMAGIISPSMPVWVIKNVTNGNYAYSNMNEGLGKVLRFGANGEDVINRLHWMAKTLGPTMAKIVKAMGNIELKPIMAQALHMGDEIHNRNAAATSLLFRKFTTTALALEGVDPKQIAESLSFIAQNDHFFLNLSMAACKAMLDSAQGVPHSTLVTVMARNGTEFGIRISGSDKWFTAPSPYVQGLFFPGYGQEHAARDLGDSAITETAGVGGFAMAAAPAIVQFVGGTPKDALNNTLRMLYITLGQNSAFTLPALDFTGTPAGIDARLVTDTGILPVINTGIAHKEAGIGQVGAGITFAPIECFTQAIDEISQHLS